jgi:hypothetical protein
MLQVAHIELQHSHVGLLGEMFALPRKQCSHTAAGFKHSHTIPDTKHHQATSQATPQNTASTSLKMKMNVDDIPLSTHVRAAPR